MKEKKISFQFHPYNFDTNEHAVEKSDSQGKRRYLKGITSGPKVDAHGERMSEECIQSFMDQANSGDILLYPDIHGIKHSEDIGIMTKAEVLPDGDWLTEYRLYDNLDNVDDLSVQKANKIWSQINGLPPYTRARQKGFSIEGFIPDGVGSVHFDAKGKQVINDVMLDGVVVVPRPAYESSIAHSVYKALGEPTPWADKSTLVSHLSKKVQEGEDRESFYREKYQLEDAVDSLVREAMLLPESEQRERLSEIFQEYQALMINLILGHPSEYANADLRRDSVGIGKTVTKSELLNGLMNEIDRLVTVRGE
jgi:hypothetical protein